jgi:hypothetical protein
MVSVLSHAITSEHCGESPTLRDLLLLNSAIALLIWLGIQFLDLLFGLRDLELGNL